MSGISRANNLSHKSIFKLPKSDSLVNNYEFKFPTQTNVDSKTKTILVNNYGFKFPSQTNVDSKTKTILVKNSGSNQFPSQTNADSEKNSSINHNSHSESCDNELPPVYLEKLPEQGLTLAPTALGASSVLAPLDLSQTFFLNSLPGANQTIYLDFDGNTTSGTYWNSASLEKIVTPAFDIDANSASFSSTEQERIQYIWQRVAEDFIPFNVNVTTQAPTDINDLIKSGTNDPRWGVRVSIGGSSNDWFGQSAGGVAYLGSFNWNSDTPVFVFPQQLGNGNEKYTAEAITHEVGHSLGLNHDGRINPNEEYYQGNGSGETGWAPIMGAAYYQNLSQWSKGEYASANNTEDDLQIITTRNGFGYRIDDAGNTIATAKALNIYTSISNSTFTANGIIERNTDVDYYSFFTKGASSINLTVNPAAHGPNLDILAQLYDFSGTLIASSNPTDLLSANITANLVAGNYYLAIDGVGKGDPLTTGYTDYGSLGQYFIVINGAVINDINNTLNGGDGNDTLNGGASIDTLIGGKGDDIYIVDRITDTITENANEGTDTIQSTVTFSLDSLPNIENLTLTGTNAINGTGNVGNNVLTGNSGNNSLDGSDGNDTLDGGAGTDTLIGDKGDDIYIVDSITDTITENANEGTDTIQSTVTFSLDSLPNIENLTLTGTTAINGTGNVGNNVLTGNDGNNRLDGGAGTDTLIGGKGDDIYIVDSITDTITENANEGTDTIQSTVTFSLDSLPNIENLTLTGTTAINGTGNVGNNVLTGNSGNNSLDGSDGNDTLDGGAGTDTLIGDKGDDIYIVDSITDTITENANEGTDTIQSTVTFSLDSLPNIENLTLTGTTAINGTGNVGNNVLTGNSGNNSLDGSDGNDTLDGGAGTDTLIGDKGDDIYIVDSITDTITENANEGTDTIQSTVTFSLDSLPNIENLTLTGTNAINGTGNVGNNVLTGNSRNNSLDGSDGNDTLDGGAGTDTLIGDKGDDIYIVDSITDTITENANEGTDTIQSTVTFSLDSLPNIENLTLTGTNAINGTGNVGNNVLTGNSRNNSLDGSDGNDTLDGSAGTDTLIGGKGDDIYIVNSTTDTITENANEGTDTIQSTVTFSLDSLPNIENLTLTGTNAINGTGNVGNNILTGNDGNNRLDGGAGTDTLIGGRGNDIYIVDSITDTITENANEGTDTIQSTVTFSLASLPNIEKLTLTGTNAINGTGNISNNILTGNESNNTLDGGAGTDILIGGRGDDIYIVNSTTDTIKENINEGTDTIQSTVTFSLASLPNIENLTLTGTTAINGTGNVGNNILTGNDGNNRLDGGAGTDTLIGGKGDDIYIVDSITDTITENANKGTDTIQSTVTFSLDSLPNIENLTLTGTTAINGTGNVGNNVLTGNSGNNSLDGSDGNDTLNGGAGTDTLIGGKGDDIYIVNSTTDTITENANEGTDTIQSTVTFSLASLPNIENLTLTGTNAINGTGNVGNNILTGNDGNNRLDGGAGTDTLIGGKGDDIYIVDSITDTITENANEGTDTIQSTVTFSLDSLPNIENLTLIGTTAINGKGNVSNNVLTGNSGNNSLDGSDGNDTLNGGAGTDTLIGGRGDDIYIVNSTTDTITENANEGTDTIQSTVTFSLASLPNIENLTLTGTTTINGTGNAGDNVLTGNDGNNTLDGGAGNDIVTGGLKKDTLTGGLGADRFDYRQLTDSVFNTFDVIKDFNADADNDLFLVSTTISTFSNVGSMAYLSTNDIVDKLTTTSFTTNSAAQFSFGSRTFVAINDATGGFNPSNDAIIEVTGLIGTLGLNNFTTTLV